MHGADHQGLCCAAVWVHWLPVSDWRALRGAETHALSSMIDACRAKWIDVGQSPDGKVVSYSNGLSVIDHYAQRVYADQINEFRPAVAAADPHGTFKNKWLAEMFGLA